MTNFVELISSFPTVVFTALLAFCMAWWLVATVAGIGDGVDAEADPDGALDDIGDALGISAVPPAIGLSILSFFGWVVSILVTLAVESASNLTGSALAVVGVGSLIVAFALGVLITRPLARRAAPLFVTELAPSERDAVGAYARVRSPELGDEDGPQGEVVVTTGSLRGAIFAARARPGHRYVSGATVHIIDADHVRGRLLVTVDDPVPELAP